MKTKNIGLFIFALPIVLVLISACKADEKPKYSDYREFFSINNNTINIYSRKVTDTINIALFSDTHLSLKDDREKPYEQYSKRMSEAYIATKHYKTGQETSPQTEFTEAVKTARNKNVDLLALLGDIFSYPSEYAVEWADSVLNASKLAYIYIAGNHDWHYEGMQGSSAELRETWINNRLLPLYQGKNPLFYSVDIKGLKIIAIDNSTYEISDEQLSFFLQEVKSNSPIILMMHIPLYMPDRPITYGCAHPNWKKENDRIYELERREPWPEKGHTTTTMQFREEVLNTPNLIAVISGHIHNQSLDVINGLPLFVMKENATGNHYNIRVIPMQNNRLSNN